MVQLNEELLELLDFRAQHDGVSRSHVIRVAIEAYLGEDRERRLDRLIIEGYRRMPQDSGEDERDLAAFSTAAATAAIRAVQAEEPEPW